MFTRKYTRRSKKRVDLNWEDAADIKEMIVTLVHLLELDYINLTEITYYRSNGSSARAYARIWSLPRIFQQALQIRPHYVIEVLSEHFDDLSDERKQKVLIHELLHIPKNFSGALVAHKGRNHKIDKKVELLFSQLKKLR